MCDLCDLHDNNKKHHTNSYFRCKVSDLCDICDLVIFYLLLFAYINRFSVSCIWNFFFFFQLSCPLDSGLGLGVIPVMCVICVIWYFFVSLMYAMC